MAFSQRIEQRQSQSLVMTQQLQQSIKLLQMTGMEVRTYIDQQLQQNPFLLGDEELLSEQEAEECDQSEEKELASTEDNAEEVSELDAEVPEQEWSELDPAERMDIGELHTPITNNGGGDSDINLLEATQAEDITLQQHLMAQLQMMIADPATLLIAQHLVDLVDEAGYITENLSNIAVQLGTEVAHVEAVLSYVQHCEPTGVGARNLQECLSLQLKEQNHFDPAMEKLVGRLDLVASGNFDALKRQCAVDAEDVRDMVSELRRLNPKPGLAFAHHTNDAIQPDVFVQRDVRGNWHLELNSQALPRVLVNKRYHASIVKKTKGEEKKFLTECMAEANWLMKALDQRANTILRVATDILSQQKAFFDMGIHHLRPLTLKDIAAETGFHESTVSRVTTGKYMMTPRGLFELKYFFTSGLSHGAGGDDVSSQTVKHVIKELIENEKPGKILSDDEIAKQLKKRNINVARRTVAKYREAMHIGSSTERRRMKRLHNS